MEVRFFFYGTLTHEATNPFAQQLHARLRPIGRAFVRGQLHAIRNAAGSGGGGWYPALLSAGTPGRVWGYLYETTADFAAVDLARMDAYEGYDPAKPDAGDYSRGPIEAHQDGRAVSVAQVYRHGGRLPADSRAIPGGDFAEWLAANGLRAFAPGDTEPG